MEPVLVPARAPGRASCPRASIALAFLLALVFGAPARAARPAQVTRPTPEEIVQACYAWHFAHDMAFTRESVDGKTPWLTPELRELCLARLARPASADEVPDIDGDPFTDSQEYPKEFRLGKTIVDGTTARVRVSFAGPGRHHPVDVVLTSATSAWRIADIRYDKQRTLRGMLGASP